MKWRAHNLIDSDEPAAAKLAIPVAVQKIGNEHCENSDSGGSQLTESSNGAVGGTDGNRHQMWTVPMLAGRLADISQRYQYWPMVDRLQLRP
jgi:hypothetical protein